MTAAPSDEAVSGGPNELNQVFTVHTRYGFVSRCGCGWRALHDTKIAGLTSGQRHVHTRHREISE